MSDDEDPFRYCVYCRADCYADEPEHAADCPDTTGVFPVRKEDLGPHCPECGYHPGMRCMDCAAVFEIGDFYMHREVESPDPLLPGIEGAGVYEIICVGCMAKEALADV